MPKIKPARIRARGNKDRTWRPLPGFGDGVYPVVKTDKMTQPVGRDEKGRLFTAPTGGGGGSGTVTSVAGVAPDETGNVPLTPEDIGAAEIDVTDEEVNLVVVSGTAAVGQTIVVDSVDEDGYPVSWHAVDLPEGGGPSVEIDDTLTKSGKAADAAIVGQKLTEQAKAIANKLDKSGDTLGGKFVIPTADTKAGFVNSEDMKIFGYGTNNFRMGDPNKPLELRGSGTNPMFGSKKILVEGDITGGLLSVETITIGDDGGGETETIPVTGLTLDLTSYSAKAGNGFYINPVVLPTTATNKAVTWKSNAVNIATVDGSGYVECIAEGSAVITCTTADGGFTATCAVSVAADDNGGEEGGETTNEKVLFSTLDNIAGGMMKPDGTVITSIAKTWHVSFPYTEGMFVSTGTNGGWNTNTYPPVLVLDGGTYSAPSMTKADSTITIDSSIITHYSGTLTGYSADAVVYANILSTGVIDGNLKPNMDNAGIFYYIPGGAE